MSQLTIHATHTRAAVNLGDHAQELHEAIAVTEETTLGDLVRGKLAKFPYGPENPQIEEFDYITIKVAQPIRTPRRAE